MTEKREIEFTELPELNSSPSEDNFDSVNFVNSVQVFTLRLGGKNAFLKR
jgi:hypothetical protein